jgi:hypothetical protein
MYVKQTILLMKIIEPILLHFLTAIALSHMVCTYRKLQQQSTDQQSVFELLNYTCSGGKIKAKRVQ